MENPLTYLKIINKKTGKPLEIEDIEFEDMGQKGQIQLIGEERDWFKQIRNFRDADIPFLKLFVIKQNNDIHPIFALDRKGIAIRYGSFPAFHKDLSDFKELLIVDKYEKYPFEEDFTNMRMIETLFQDRIDNIKLKRGMNRVKRDFEEIFNKKYLIDEIRLDMKKQLCSVVRMIDYYKTIEMHKGTRTSVLRLLNSFEHELTSFELRRNMDKMYGVTRAITDEVERV